MDNSSQNKPKKLYRSQSDRMIAGVCGGIAAYLGVDSSVVRLLWVFITLVGGSGILVYIILWIVVPDESRLRATGQL